MRADALSRSAAGRILGIAERERRMERKKILLIEDDESLLLALRYMLEDMGYEPVVACTHAQADVALDGDGPYVAAIIDYLIDNVPASPLIAQLRRRHPHTPLLCTTADTRARVEADGARPDAFLPKPFRTEELRSALRALLEE